MDPSKRDDPPAASFTPTLDALASPTPTSDPVNRSPRMNDVSMLATPLPVSLSGCSSSSLLSPANAPARATSQAHTTPRRISSSSSLRDEHRGSSLKKRSSTASLRSVRNDSRTSTSPHRSVSQHSTSSLSSSPTATIPTTLGNPNMLSKKSRLAKANELPIPTAASIATDHFQREVELHQSADLQSQTLVVIHDACYGHRFSRPRASRAALGSIVERPERIQASVLGVSAAYVRLAHRYEGGRFAPNPDMNLDELPVPPFQIRRTGRSMALSSPAVTHVHGSRWMDDLKTMCDTAESRLALNGKELVRPPSAGKDGAMENAPSLHEGDLYLCSESLNAFEGALGGVCEGVDAVFGPKSTKRAFVCIRPPGHHCSSDHPSGFCWINNVHVGISYAAMTHGLTHAAILDFDLHHGDGSQEIAWEQNRKATAAPRSAANYKKTAIGYFSLHDINSYPCEMGEPEKVRNASVCIDKAHGQSVWNVHLEQWKTEVEFWDLYASKYAVLIEKARAFLRFHTERLASTPNGPPPVAAIFFSAGFDASEWEGAGMQRHKVNVPTEFYAKFTADVVRMAEEEGLGVDGRIVSVLEGGYSNRALTTGVLSHLSGLGDATSCLLSGRVDDKADRLTAEMTNRLGLLDISANVQQPSGLPVYDSGWWSPALLEELEALAYPPPALKSREKSTPTYFAPTQSFTAKVVTTPRDRRSTGSQISVETDAPPLPPISWATATHELSRILIPSHRQTTSCRPEDLNAEATRLRRERQTAAQHTSIPSAGNAESRMKLRARKPKTPLPETPNAETPKRQAIANNRRTTIERASDLPDPSLDKSPNTRSTTRRKSATSTIASTLETKASGDKTVRSASVTSTRRPGSSRSATPKRPSSPKMAPPVPRVPSVYTNLSAGEGAAMVPVESRSLSGDTPDTPQDDVDSLAAGVRKLNIKLKVPSPEEHAARERERERQTSKRVFKTPNPFKKSSGTKGLNAPVNKSEACSNMALVRPEAENPIPSSPTTTDMVAEGSGIPGGTVLNSRSAIISTAVPSQTLPPEMAISPPITPGATHDITRPQHALYSPPISEPSLKAGIPVFTSNSPIPFAPASAHDRAAPSRPPT
ncbi:histone deacetylase HosB [Aspergillus bombycis]|uniref:Histone deacetylase HosB n=1 Tax=Aspergillus bombycis TaxID=109264 RepID=A0A1F7ZIS3_9EURO|nr:histone deacetylase HosB [Aspergillus bombycis]OGM39350.1 histone deacetylase HosB [Aspergillus bombycis]